MTLGLKRLIEFNGSKGYAADCHHLKLNLRRMTSIECSSFSRVIWTSQLAAFNYFCIMLIDCDLTCQFRPFYIATIWKQNWSQSEEIACLSDILFSLNGKFSVYLFMSCLRMVFFWFYRMTCAVSKYFPPCFIFKYLNKQTLCSRREIQNFTPKCFRQEKVFSIVAYRHDCWCLFKAL